MLKEYFQRFRMPVLRIICFLIIVVSLTYFSQFYLQYRERYNDNSSFQIINFYKEEKNTADAVFIGSSCCFSFYSPLFAYDNYHIKTMNYSSSGMGMMAYRYAIEEVRKYQKDAVIVLTITPLYQMEYLGVHFMSDYMPLSRNKIAFLTRYFTHGDESILNSIGFFFPIMEYHDRWSELDKDDFIIDEGIKGATRHKYYLSYVNSISDLVFEDEAREQMPADMEFYMTDLLDYCDEHNEKIVFLLPPRTYSEEEYRQMSSLTELIRNRGYELLDLRNSFEDIGLFTEQDFYDIDHTNIHGSLKYTDYLLKYVMYKYPTSEVSDPEWDKAVERYYGIIEPYVLDVETDLQHRHFWLPYPELLSAEEENGEVVLRWKEAEGADSYCVYRKEDGGFVRISDIISGDTYVDDTAEKGKTYVYTVLSCWHDGDECLYGNYDYKGLEIEVK